MPLMPLFSLRRHTPRYYAYSEEAYMMARLMLLDEGDICCYELAFIAGYASYDT